MALTPEEQNQLKIRHLALQSEAISNAIGQLWFNYCQLFEIIDLTDETAYNKCVDMVMELDENLVNILGQVREKASVMDGYFEPIPEVEGGDFESDVLRDLANLDKIPDTRYNQKDMGWDDPENPHLIDEIPPMSFGQYMDGIRRQYYNG